jgi:hypothetical protein
LLDVGTHASRVGQVHRHRVHHHLHHAEAGYEQALDVIVALPAERRLAAHRVVGHRAVTDFRKRAKDFRQSEAIAISRHVRAVRGEVDRKRNTSRVECRRRSRTRVCLRQPADRSESTRRAAERAGAQAMPARPPQSVPA